MANRTVMLKDKDKFIEIIIEKGFSYRQLAKRSYTSQTTISLIVNGERNPSPKTAVNICKALECQFEEIFFIQNDYNSNRKNQYTKTKLNLRRKYVYSFINFNNSLDNRNNLL